MASKCSTRLFGIETEYAFTAFLKNGKVAPPQEAVGQLLQLARKRLVYLPARSGSGMFLQNGSRFYVDTGHHPELATPECADPWDLVRYVLAGEKILSSLASELVVQPGPIARAQFFKSNVEYSGSGSTWGCHESYLHRANPSTLPRQLIPHLVSRIVFCGAGGFNNCSRALDFVLSPRAPHLEKVVSECSTSHRGIFHSKNESLSSRGYHRLHVLTGESLCSQLATWLKVATTAIVVALTEAKLEPGEAVKLESPVSAMQVFGRDTQCKASVPGVGGRPLSAIAIQRHYLEVAEKHLDHRLLPAWAEEACRLWRAVLDMLETDLGHSERVLDWGIKRALFRRHAEKRGVKFERLAQRFTKGGIVGSVWGALSKELKIKQELFEIDARFGQLWSGDGRSEGCGIFRLLDRSGVLEHGVDGVDEVDGVNRVDHAVCNPPATGRARVRGECIGKLHSSTDEYYSDWQGIWSRKKNVMLDLRDPFTSTENWRPCRKSPDNASRERLRLLLDFDQTEGM